VGSLLRSAALKDARAKCVQGEISAAALTQIEDREIKTLIARQEAIGLKSVTDGEYRRESWQTDFLRALPGIETLLGDRKLKFQGARSRSNGSRASRKSLAHSPAIPRSRTGSSSPTTRGRARR